MAAATATGGPSVAPPDISALDAAVVEAAAAVEAVAERVAAVGVGDFDSFAGEAVDARVFPCGALTVCWFDGDFLTARS